MVYLILHIFLLALKADFGAPMVTPPPKYISGDNQDIDAARSFLETNDRLSSEQCNLMAKASWNYASNLTEENKKIMLEAQQEMAKFTKETWENATSFAWKTFDSDPKTYRWFKKLAILGSAALPNEKFKELNKLIADMEDTYGTAKVCPRNKPNEACTLTLEPDLTRVLTESRDYEELKYVWEAWRNVSGKMMKDKYLKYIELSNEAALLNGFKDNGEYWRENYESETFCDEIEELWKTLRPFYQQLHAYVRRKLMETYPGKIKADGPIPAHLLGNMWSQTWGNIFKLVEPYKNKPPIDVTSAMKEKKMNELDMFKLSEEFFKSLGLKPMTPEFWHYSIIKKPTDRELVCHASAWDFCDGKDFRIKMCTDINMEDLITVHHEMGHIQYYLQYADQPNVFREGANSGFHEAVGDVLALSVSTPDHMKKIDLLQDVEVDNETEVNYLLNMALNKIAFLPFGYIIDLWRWDTFNGSIKPEEMNTKWWELRLKYQGICPPVKRTEDDFDPAAKYHVAADVPYIRYFVSTIVQFQFHKALCDAAGYEGPLHRCDIYKSKEAGELLGLTLKQGSSIIWNDAMEIITRNETNKMDATAILQYFDPLIKWLKQKNKDEVIGWNSEEPLLCP